MKLCKSFRMRKLLSQGLAKARKVKRPHEGMMRSLIYKTLRNGWHYQVEYICDHRNRPRPCVVVYAFKPPADFTARSADLYLTQEV